MQEPLLEASEAAPTMKRSRRRIRYGAIGTVIAALIGLLALAVSAYTAYIQRQQVRAQVWPYLTSAYVDPVASGDGLHKLAVFSKGVGPAIVRSVQVSVDGKSQPDWKHVFDALDLSSIDFGYSTLDENVLSPGEVLPALVFPDGQALSRFRKAMNARGEVRICYCSTLGECWMSVDRKSHSESKVLSVAACPQLSQADSFDD